jgi:hypothetical protein
MEMCVVDVFSPPLTWVVRSSPEMIPSIKVKFIGWNFLANVGGQMPPLASGGADAPASDMPEVPQGRGLSGPLC